MYPCYDQIYAPVEGKNDVNLLNYILSKLTKNK
jgi:hypothetical protein